MFALVTLGGHLLKGKSVKGVSGFFKGDNDIPWWAVSASIIATKISALTFIALPAKVFVDGGNIEYALAIGGFVLGNILMAFIFVKPYYESGVYSPYDFIGKRIHPNVAVLSRLLFLLGTILSQSVRLLATAIVLQVISGLGISTCIVIIVVFSVVWSLIGGIKTVIWTDLILFGIFICGGLVALVTTVSGADMAMPEMLRVLDDQAKLKLLNLSLDPKITYTLWAGLIGAAVFELGSNAIDQVVTQRILCCRSQKDARLAVLTSAFSVVPTVLMLLVGLGLVVFFHQHPLPDAQSHMHDAGQDTIFPYFVAHHIPVGLSGIILAGIFASGISTLDSALTALAQTTVVGIRKSLEGVSAADDVILLRKSRAFVVLWGLVVLAISMTLWAVTSSSEKGLLDIGLQVPAFVYGALLGLAFLALRGNARPGTAFLGAALGCAATLCLWKLGVGFFWWYPVAGIFTYGVGSISTRKPLQP